MFGKWFSILFFLGNVLVFGSVRADGLEEKELFDPLTNFQGCYSENFIVVGNLGVSVYDHPVLTIKSKEKGELGGFEYLGPIVCDDNGAYFTNANGLEATGYYFSFSDFSVVKITGSPGCMVYGIHKSGLLCGQLSDGGRTIIGVRSDNGVYKEILNLDHIGISEYFPMATYDKIYLPLDVRNRNGMYTIGLDRSVEFVGEFDLNGCSSSSTLSYKNERIYHYCDGKLKYEYGD